MNNRYFITFLLRQFFSQVEVKTHQKFFLLLTLTIFGSLPFTTQALTIENLINSNQLTIETQIQNQKQQIVGQPLIFTVEVSTNRWFNKGTQLKTFELTDTVILANSEITINSTKKINGRTWSSQTREITLYPTRSGEYILPSIDVLISVNTENNGVVEGIIATTEQPFTISLPEALVSLESFLVSTKVSLTIEGSLDKEHSYEIGEAITQTITINATNTPAMMIPPLATQELTGISIYQKPAQVFDKANRGELLGTRIETITYIFEQAGDYKIPQQIIYWWNTSNNKLEEIIIPESFWSVGRNKNDVNKPNNNAFSLSKEQLKHSLFISTLVIFISIVLFVLYHYKRTLFIIYSKVTQLEKRTLRHDFLQAITKQEYAKANQYLYQYSMLMQGVPKTHHSPSRLRAILNQLAFAHESINSRKINFNQQDGKALLKEITKNKMSIESSLTINKAIELNK
ncbi:BatD family protein [Candidatus Colwellia aromaticivorans]|uniref:BatD family protein n=1 Tax=Candidatus Colwellia aromaticivorans TaxID=2267621 RepID=UPI000DF2C7C8|nr:BatD family protein [Candidatus Colwellia aromaticivorans]